MNKKILLSLVISVLIILSSTGFYYFGLQSGISQQQSFILTLNNKISKLENDQSSEISLLKQEIETVKKNSASSTELAITYFKEDLIGQSYAYSDFNDAGIVHFVNEKGDEFDIKSPANVMGGSTPNVLLSPSKKFIFLAYPAGDGSTAFVYVVATKEMHELSVIVSGLKPFEWLPDNRLSVYEGCVIAGFCKKYESISAAKPWDLKLVD